MALYQITCDVEDFDKSNAIDLVFARDAKTRKKAEEALGDYIGKRVSARLALYQFLGTALELFLSLTHGGSEEGIQYMKENCELGKIRWRKPFDDNPFRCVVALLMDESNQVENINESSLSQWSQAIGTAHLKYKCKNAEDFIELMKKDGIGIGALQKDYPREGKGKGGDVVKLAYEKFIASKPLVQLPSPSGPNGAARPVLLMGMEDENGTIRVVKVLDEKERHLEQATKLVETEFKVSTKETNVPVWGLSDVIQYLLPSNFSHSIQFKTANERTTVQCLSRDGLYTVDMPRFEGFVEGNCMLEDFYKRNVQLWRKAKGGKKLTVKHLSKAESAVVSEETVGIHDRHHATYQVTCEDANDTFKNRGKECKTLKTVPLITSEIKSHHDGIKLKRPEFKHVCELTEQQVKAIFDKETYVNISEVNGKVERDKEYPALSIKNGIITIHGAGRKRVAIRAGLPQDFEIPERKMTTDHWVQALRPLLKLKSPIQLGIRFHSEYFMMDFIAKNKEGSVMFSIGWSAPDAN